MTGRRTCRTRRAAGLTWYKKLGYVAADKTAESASSTLEDTYDDYAVAQVAG